MSVLIAFPAINSYVMVFATGYYLALFLSIILWFFLNKMRRKVEKSSWFVGYSCGALVSCGFVFLTGYPTY